MGERGFPILRRISSMSNFSTRDKYHFIIIRASPAALCDTTTYSYHYSGIQHAKSITKPSLQMSVSNSERNAQSLLQRGRDTRIQRSHFRAHLTASGLDKLPILFPFSNFRITIRLLLRTSRLSPLKNAVAYACPLNG